MSGAQSISTRRAYGVQRVCRVWHRARSSVYARRQATRSPALCHRRGPIGAAPDDVLVAHIRRVLEASPFHGEGYRKAWAKLRVAGMRTSKERVRRLMREHDLQAPPRAGHAHPAEGARRDHHHRGARRDVGHRHAGHRDGRRGGGLRLRGRRSLRDRMHRAPCRQAREPLRGPGADPPGYPRTLRGHRRRRGPWAAAASRPRVELPANSDDFQQEVAFFGIEEAPRSFVREPEGNGVAERFTEGVLWVAESRRSRSSAWPCSSSSGRPTQWIWRSTTTEARPRCDATSSGWTRRRRSEYRQTTVRTLRRYTQGQVSGFHRGHIEGPHL